MRENLVFTLLWLFAAPAWTQTASSEWRVVKDSKSACQIGVPPEWVPLTDSAGAAVFQDATTAIAIVTSQPGQAFKPMPEFLQKLLDIPKGKMFENTAKRIFYQDKVAKTAEETNAYSASVPGKTGTCSCRVVFHSSVTEDTAKKIVFSLGALPE